MWYLCGPVVEVSSANIFLWCCIPWLHICRCRNRFWLLAWYTLCCWEIWLFCLIVLLIIARASGHTCVLVQSYVVDILHHKSIILSLFNKYHPGGMMCYAAFIFPRRYSSVSLLAYMYVNIFIISWDHVSCFSKGVITLRGLGPIVHPRIHLISLNWTSPFSFTRDRVTSYYSGSFSDQGFNISCMLSRAVLDDHYV